MAQGICPDKFWRRHGQNSSFNWHGRADRTQPMAGYALIRIYLYHTDLVVGCFDFVSDI
jgi:hypothetical protein